MAINSDKLEFTYSVQKLIGLLFGGLAMTCLSGLVAFRIIPNVRPGSFAEFAGYGGILFFGMATMVIAWRLATHRGPVVTLTPSGFHDVRLSSEEIPWISISGLGHAKIRKQDLLIIAVDPAVEAQLTLTRVARWSREPNRKLGIDGLCTSAQGLNTTFETLYDVCEMHLRRVHQGAPQGGRETLVADFSVRASDRL